MTKNYQRFAERKAQQERNALEMKHLKLQIELLEEQIKNERWKRRFWSFTSGLALGSFIFGFFKR